jgi:hypothetical protein
MQGSTTSGCKKVLRRFPARGRNRWRLSAQARRQLWVLGVRGVIAGASLGSSTAFAQTEPVKPSLKVGVGARTGLALDFDDEVSRGASLSLNDGLVDQFQIRPLLSGQLTENIGFVANFETGSSRGLGIAVLDAIGQVKFTDEFQVWIGQHIPANDRNNMNGPFFASGWNFPITVQSYPFDVGARDRGFTVWGLVGGGVLKYHLSMVDLQPPSSTQTDAAGGRVGAAKLGHARFGGRVTLNLWDPENYYYCSGTYFGSQDTFAIGLVAQYQEGVPLASGVDNDFFGYSADLLIEKNLGVGGTLTFEGGYWNFEDVGEGYLVNQGTSDQGAGVFGPAPGSSYMAAVSWLSPEKVGIGKLQPNGRLQYGDYGTDPTMTIDVGLGYVIDGFNHRWNLNFRHQEAGDAAPPDNWLQIGAQFQM